MARLARIVVPGLPYHIIHRGNRRQNVFFRNEDRTRYLDILNLQAKSFGLEIWAYCLMNNHVHLIVVPESEESLSAAIGETHKSYTRMINFREKWRGSLWEGRFKSMVMDEPYVYMAVRYVERNPVRAGIVKRAENYQWSSARYHVKRKRDRLLSDFYLVKNIKNWSQYLRDKEDEQQLMKFRCQSSSGRPLGSETFLRKLESDLGRAIIKLKPGPKR